MDRQYALSLEPANSSHLLRQQVADLWRKGPWMLPHCHVINRGKQKPHELPRMWSPCSKPCLEPPYPSFQHVTAPAFSKRKRPPKSPKWDQKKNSPPCAVSSTTRALPTVSFHPVSGLWAFGRDSHQIWFICWFPPVPCTQKLLNTCLLV